MRKRNKVKQLQRNSSHRKAMLSNLVTSLLYHERIESTVAKAKATRQLAERMITKAKHGNAAESAASKINNIRTVGKVVKDKEVLSKLFNDIALRYEARPGGYTRIIRLGKRPTDNSEMAVIELVDRKELAELKEERKAIRESRSGKSAGVEKKSEKADSKKEKAKK